MNKLAKLSVVVYHMNPPINW